MWGNPYSISEILDSGILEIFSFGIRNPGFWNPEYRPTNLESHNDWKAVQGLLTNTGIQYLEYGILSVDSRIQDCPGFPYIWRIEQTNTKEITEDISIVKLHISDLHKAVILQTNSKETIIKTQHYKAVFCLQSILH